MLNLNNFVQMNLGYWCKFGWVYHVRVMHTGGEGGKGYSIGLPRQIFEKLLYKNALYL
jgi:hypothetical protein